MRKLLLIALLMASWVNAQDTLEDQTNGRTMYEIVVEDDMINYPFGKDFPGKITVVGNGFIFLDTTIPYGFDEIRPVGSHPQEVPQLWYYDGGGTLHTVLANTGIVYIPTSNTSFWAQWHWRRLGVDGNEVAFGPIFFSENN